MFTQRARTHVIDSMIWMNLDSVMKSKLVSTGYVKVSMHCLVEGRTFFLCFDSSVGKSEQECSWAY
jgi:hypothetical protein